MFVERISKEVACDACSCTISKVMHDVSPLEQNLQHFCEPCSKRIVNFQLYKKLSLEDAIVKIIEEGQYKKSLNDQGIVLL